MNGIEERVHTCVSVTANTTVAMLPARVFQVLITSQFPARMYKSAEKLRRLREARTDWYDIRMSLGDSAARAVWFLGPLAIQAPPQRDPRRCRDPRAKDHQLVPASAEVRMARCAAEHTQHRAPPHYACS